MSETIVAVLTEDDIHNLEVADNKIICAQQALHPNAVPPYAPRSAADKFFREAIFALADARYLQGSFLRIWARRHDISQKDRKKLFVDYKTGKLILRG
jgi:hypothetical protein